MRSVQLSQGTVHYLDVGEGPALVFVHGLLVDGQIWTPVVERLSRRFRCIVPNLPLGAHRTPMSPGADLSMAGQAQLLLGFLDALGLEDVTLVGNDTGGAICQLVVAGAPPRVRQLVLTDCDAFEVFPPPGFGFLLRAARLPGLPWAAFFALKLFPPLRRLRWAWGALTYRKLPSELLQSWVEPAARDPRVRRDVLKLLGDAGPAVTLGVAPRLRQFEGRVLIVWSRDDRFFAPALGERLASAFRRAELMWVDRAGLLLPLDVPDALASAITGFVGSGKGNEAGGTRAGGPRAILEG